MDKTKQLKAMLRDGLVRGTSASDGQKVQHDLAGAGLRVRRFVPDDVSEVQNIIHRGLREVNGKDYSAELIEDFCAHFTAEKLLAQADSAHVYVATSSSGRILGTGTIAPYWGSATESILLTIYVLPELIGNGIGTAIVQALEKDAFSLRATRIEIPSSVTAVGFYRKFGYLPKNGIDEPDEEGLVRLEKFRNESAVVPKGSP